MPTTVSELFANADLPFDGPVQWARQEVKNENPCAYVVSTSKDPQRHLGLLTEAPISIDLVKEWIHRVPWIELDGVRNPAAIDIANRLAQFWLPDENILYIGMTTKKVQTRINQYYNTPIGNRSPHAGGHWLKTLSNLQELFIYHAACNTPKTRADKLLGYFISNVSTDSRLRLKDPDRPFPFANLEYPKWTRKNHGISKSRV